MNINTYARVHREPEHKLYMRAHAYALLKTDFNKKHARSVYPHKDCMGKILVKYNAASETLSLWEHSFLDLIWE